MKKAMTVMILMAMVMVYSASTAKANDLNDLISSAIGGAIYGQLDGKNTKSTLRGAGAGAAGQVAVMFVRGFNGGSNRGSNGGSNGFNNQYNDAGGQTQTTRTIQTTEKWQNGQFSGATQRETYNRITKW